MTYQVSCLNKNDCVRNTEQDYRSLLFDFDCETGNVGINTVTSDNQVNHFDPQAETIWCPRIIGKSDSANTWTWQYIAIT